MTIKERRQLGGNSEKTAWHNNGCPLFGRNGSADQRRTLREPIGNRERRPETAL